MDLLNENKIYTVDSIINEKISVNELDEILKTNNEILKCAILLNKNTDKKTVSLLCEDQNAMVSNWAKEKSSKCSSDILYINMTNKYDMIVSKIMLDCFEASSTGGVTIFLDKLVDEYNLSADDIDNIYEILIGNDDILQIDYDKYDCTNIHELSFDIAFNWHKCFYYDPMTEDEKEYIDYQTKYLKLFKKRFVYEVKEEKNKINLITITDKLTDTTVLQGNFADPKLAEYYYHNFLIDSIDNVLDEILEEQCNEFSQIQY